MSEYSNVYASVIDFETACFDESIQAGKPQNAIDKLRDGNIYNKVKSLLSAILNNGNLPNGTIKWEAMEDIDTAFDRYAEDNPDVIPVL